MSKMRQYKRFLLLLALLPTASLASAQKKKDVPQDRFAVTVSIDSAIASVPQKMYMFSLGEGEARLHDSISFDSIHRMGTMHGALPYESLVHLMLVKRGPHVVPFVAQNNDSLHIHIGDEDDGFGVRYIDKVEGSPSTLELVRFHQKEARFNTEMNKLTGNYQLYNLSDAQQDSVRQLINEVRMKIYRDDLAYANTGKSPFTVLNAARSVKYAMELYKNRGIEKPFQEEEVDAMMHSLLKRFPDYPPIRAFVNDSTLNSYLSAETFSGIDALDLRLHSRRFYVQDDTIKRPLKVGDYMNLPLHDGDVNEFRGKFVLVDFWGSWCKPCMAQMPNIRYAAQEFRDDLVVCLIGMDKNRKHWWTTIKENDMRNKDITETDRPYQIHHYRAYDDDKGEMWPEINRLGIQTLPHNYLVDRSGKIIAKDISITLAIDKISGLLEKEKEKEK